MQMNDLRYNYIICSNGGGFYDVAFADVIKLNNVRYFPTFCHGVKNFVQKFLFRVNFSQKVNKLVKGPFSNYVNKRLYKCDLIDKPNTIVIFFANVGYVYNTSYIEYLKRKNPSLKFVLYFTDLVSRTYGVDITYIKSTFDIVISYDKGDSDKYGFKYYPTPYSDIVTTNMVNNQIISSDVYFCGKAKDRYQEIFNVYNACVSKGLKCDFYIYELSEDKRICGRGLHYDVPMSYIDNVRRLQQSRVILEIMQRTADGFTPRLWEAIMYDKHLLTNNDSVFYSSYYDKDGIHSIDILNNDGKWQVLKNQVSYSERTKKLLSPVNFLRFVDSQFI